MYSNRLQTQHNELQVPDPLSNRYVAGLPVLRPLYEHQFWTFFKQAELTTGSLFSESERKMITERSKIKKFRRRQYVLQAGDPCRFIGFIIKGAVKTYSINERGQESIVSFGMENDWLTDMESFFGNEASNYHIEVLEDLEIILLDSNQLSCLVSSVPLLSAFLQRFQLKQLVESQKRINAALSMTAEERYADLLTTKPEYPRRFSQNMLACYLGIKPETLCRIRKH